MKLHTSIPVDNTVEVIDAVEISPLISHAKVKVCYVGQDPNRNGTVITKDVATEMGRKLPGSPVVGLYLDDEKDYDEHNREIIVKGGKFSIVDVTKPYGFVPTDAEVWFQKFNDEGVEHEYLCTECYIWTSAYPESQRIIDKGNNQSMEISKENQSGFWTNDSNSGKRIFIYNEALIEKLCILGQNVEPCFEGAQIKAEFSLENNPEFAEFKQTMYSMMKQLQETLEKGGNLVFTTYAVEIGDALWSILYNYMVQKFPVNGYESKYRIEGIYEEGTQKFVILQDRESSALYRMNFSYSDEGFAADEEMTQVTKTYVPAGQFALEDVEKWETEYAASKQKEKEEEDPDDEGEEDDDMDDEKKKNEHACGGSDEKKKKYNLEEVTEYAELQTQYADLENKYNELQTANASLTEELNTLREFKVAADRKNKQDMIDSFYMLNDEDKKDVIENIDTYTLDDIEAKLSIICVRNKVNFNLEQEEDKKDETKPGLFSLNGLSDDDDAPAWIKAVRKTANK